MGLKFVDIGHLALRRKDPGAAIRFYEEALGAKKAFDLYMPGGPLGALSSAVMATYLRLSSGQYIEIFPAAAETVSKGSYSHCCIDVQRPGETRMVEDPERNRWELRAGETGLECCVFHCKKYGEVIRFYEQTLGLEAEEAPRVGDLRGKSYEIAVGRHIDIYDVGYPGINEPERTGFHHVCLLVSDIVEAARHFERQGVMLWRAPRYYNMPIKGPYPEDGSMAGQSGSMTFYLSDPEGNEIEFMQYTEKSLQVLCNHD
jgi:catechol 2,3-dioxygenase-like lactoylglutathione lyase family enzyme